MRASGSSINCCRTEGSLTRYREGEVLSAKVEVDVAEVGFALHEDELDQMGIVHAIDLFRPQRARDDQAIRLLVEAGGTMSMQKHQAPKKTDKKKTQQRPKWSLKTKQEDVRRDKSI